MLEPGDSVDIWVVEAQLGAGGMGSVYRAHNRDAPRIKAAIKVLDTPARKAPGAQERFVREAELTFAIDHPNVVKVRNIRVDHEPPYLEMEFVEGTALEDLLNDSPLPLRRALALMRQAADALHHLHSLGVRHRDIKPANILVTDGDQLKLVDFGLAMDADADTRITKDNVSFGTVAYAPPEWVDVDRLDPVAWDTYAMGVVFWEMLTGRVAFPVGGQGSARQQAMAVILGKQGHEPLDPGDVAPHSLRDLIRDMTHSNPDTRLIDTGVVLARLRAIDTADLATTVSRTTPVPRSPPVPSVASLVTDGETRETVVGAGLIMGALLVIALFSLAAGVTVGLAVLLNQGDAAPRNVVVDLAAAPGVVVAMADRSALVQDEQAVFLDVPVGTATVSWVRAADACTLDVCPGADCPDTCVSGVLTLDVRPGESALTVPLNVPAAPAPTAPDPVVATPPEPIAPDPVAPPEPDPVQPVPAAPAPPPTPVVVAPAPAAKPYVTQRQFARFVAARPQYAKGGANAVAADYLEDWTDGGPPRPGSPVANTSPIAAQAYCAWSGSSLLRVSDPPAEVTSMEWRRDGSHYRSVWEGGAVYPTAGNAVLPNTLFRCR